jgi:hypothetical protein
LSTASSACVHSLDAAGASDVERCAVQAQECLIYTPLAVLTSSSKLDQHHRNLAKVPYRAGATYVEDWYDPSAPIGTASSTSADAHRYFTCKKWKITRPGCTAPAYHSQAHHDDGWAAADSPTDIDKLSLACGPDNRLIEETGWRTRKLIDSARLRGVRPGQERLVDPIRAFTPASPRRSRGLPRRGTPSR